MIAVGAGDARAAARHAADAGRLLQHEPMTKLLRAQAAQLAGDRESAVAAYNAMLEHHETHGLGLRGLHVEARRGGDHEAALQYAMRANAHAPAAWAGQAVLDDRARRGDWAGALATVDSNAVCAADRQADRQPLARRHQDGDGGREDGARSEGRARARAAGLPSCADARSGGGDLRAADGRRRRLSPRERRFSKAPTRRRRIPTWPPPISGSGTAIRPPTGSRAPGRSPASRRTIPNRC